ncbi:MAG: helix-turn-helix transcriptional regulator [Ruminococcaceae bacterium]|nr:helix-turn-helix transcriptional regulator [Oscillospiraceae bacterium]
MAQYFVDTQDYVDQNNDWWRSVGGFHQHRQDELVLIRDGSSAMTCLGETIHLEAPAVAFYPHNIPHTQRNDPDKPYFRHRIQYSASQLDGMVPMNAIPRDFFAISLTGEEYARLVPFMDLMLAEQPNETQDERRRHLLAILLIELAPIVAERFRAPEHNPHTESRQVLAICQYIGAHYNEPLHLESLARRFFISRAKLDRLFRSVLGMTPGAYLLDIRVGYAKSFLMDGVSVQETAMRCGYTNVGYFIRLFRRYTGMTPANYRNGK